MHDTYGTPVPVFRALDAEFGFTLDPCAAPGSRTCPKSLCLERGDDGLTGNWQGERVFMNPPYGRGQLERWMCRAAFDFRAHLVLIVALVPAYPCEGWWQRHVQGVATEVRFIPGRLRFSGKGPAPFGSAVVVYAPEWFRAAWQRPAGTVAWSLIRYPGRTP